MKIKEEYGEKHEYFEIIGEDSSLENFEKWKNYKDILANAKLVVLKRKVTRAVLVTKILFTLTILILIFQQQKLEQN